MTQEERMQEEMTIEEYMDLEEQIDEERNRIAINGVQVNEVTFKIWKTKRDEKRNKEKGILAEEDSKNKKKTGIQLFRLDAAIFKDDENATDDIKYTNNEELPEEEKKIDDELKRVKINEDLFLDENLDDIDENEENEENGNEDGLEDEVQENDAGEEIKVNDK